MDKIGCAKGLVWTPDACSLLQIKATCRKGCGRLYVSGDIGQKFFETFETIFNLLQPMGLGNLNQINLNLYIPKAVDGESAGAAVFMAIYSAISKTPIKQNVAFTGQLSPEGNIYPVGNITDKLIAADRANLEAVYMPFDNLEDLALGDDDAQWGGVFLCPVRNVTEMLAITLK